MSEDKKLTTVESTAEVAPQEAAPKKRAPKKVATASSDVKKEAKEEKKESSPEAVKEERPSQPTAQDLLKEELGDVKIRKAKGSKNVSSGVCRILATFNNTKVCFTDMNGQVFSWSSAGKCGFKGSRKSTAYAAQVVTQDAGRNAIAHGLKDVVVEVKGPGLGRDSAIRALQGLGLNVASIFDTTPIPHNGCRPRKQRRV